MKRILMLKAIVIAIALSTSICFGQDVGINIIAQQEGVNNGIWPADAPVGSVAILVTICNNDGGTRSVPSYKLRPLISVPTSLVKIASADKQPGIPAGWSILTLTDGSIRLSNGTDQIEAGDCREFPIYIEPVAEGSALTVTATMGFSNGNAPGTAPGSQTVGNNPSNDNGSTAVQISAPLPVTLAAFNAVKENTIALLTWATTEETNSDRFEIERSQNGKLWDKIGVVASHRESNSLKNYTFNDQTPLSGQNLYRLRMVDRDNTFAYSSIKSLEFANDISVYPNPSSDFIRLRDVQNISSVSILDLNGRQVYRSGAVAKGEINVKNLTSGMYTIRIEMKGGGSSVQKLVVAR